MPTVMRCLLATVGFAYSVWVAFQFLGIGLVGFPKGELFSVQLLKWMFIAAVVGLSLGLATAGCTRSAKNFLLVAVAPLICMSGFFVLGAVEKGNPLSLVGAIYPLLVAGALAGGWCAGGRIKTGTTPSKLPRHTCGC